METTPTTQAQKRAFNDANAATLLPQLQSEHVSVRQERCILVRNRNASCLRCVEACTSGCISYDGQARSLVIDQARCVGCGTCATACPTCALEARRPNDTELATRCEKALEAAGAEDLTIACERADLGDADGKGVVRVTCLGRVDESLLVGMAARGAQGVKLACGPCEGCEHRPGRAVAQEVCATANRLLELWGSDARVSIAEHGSLPASQAAGAANQPASGGAPSLHGGAAAATLRKRLKVMPDGTLPHFVPDRRERLLDALATLGTPTGEAPADEACPDGTEETPLARTRLWGHVVIDLKACTSCRMCATFCPTGALAKFDEEDGTFGVDHYASDCVKCLCCQNICRAHAITVEDDVPANRLTTSVPERHTMNPVRVPKGGTRSILNSMRDLLGMPEVFER